VHGTRAVGVSQSLWRGRPTRNGITELSQRTPPIFGRAAITLGIGPHSSYCDCYNNYNRLTLAVAGCTWYLQTQILQRSSYFSQRSAVSCGTRLTAPYRVTSSYAKLLNIRCHVNQSYGKERRSSRRVRCSRTQNTPASSQINTKMHCKILQVCNTTAVFWVHTAGDFPLMAASRA